MIFQSIFESFNPILAVKKIKYCLKLKSIYSVIILCAISLRSCCPAAAPTFSLVQEPYDYPYVLFPSVAGSRSFLPTPPFSLLPPRPAIVTHCHKVMARALFRYPQNFKFFHSLSTQFLAICMEY